MNFEHSFDFRVLNGEDIMMDLNSLYSIVGFGTMIVAAMNGSTRVISTEDPQPELMLHIIEKYKVRLIIMINILYCNIIFVGQRNAYCTWSRGTAFAEQIPNIH